MRQIFIDKFVVPKNAVDEFVKRMNSNMGFIKTLPGLIENACYERTDERGNVIVITVAVWESENVLKNAKDAVQTEYRRVGFNPTEMLARLNIMVDRGTYKLMDLQK